MQKIAAVIFQRDRSSCKITNSTLNLYLTLAWCRSKSYKITNIYDKFQDWVCNISIYYNQYYKFDLQKFLQTHVKHTKEVNPEWSLAEVKEYLRQQWSLMSSLQKNRYVSRHKSKETLVYMYKVGISIHCIVKYALKSVYWYDLLINEILGFLLACIKIMKLF